MIRTAGQGVPFWTAPPPSVFHLRFEGPGYR